MKSKKRSRTLVSSEEDEVPLARSKKTKSKKKKSKKVKRDPSIDISDVDIAATVDKYTSKSTTRKGKQRATSSSSAMSHKWAQEEANCGLQSGPEGKVKFSLAQSVSGISDG